MSSLPVLILAYRRLDALKHVITALEGQEHGEIYVSSDAPKNADEVEVNEVRIYLKSLLDQGIINHLKLREKNMGIMAAVTDGIDWFFHNEKIGLIIEDDIVLLEGTLHTVSNTVPILLNSTNIYSINLRNEVPPNRLSHPFHLGRMSVLVSSHGWITSAIKWNQFRTDYRFVTMRQIFRGIPSEFGFWQKKAFIEDLKRNKRYEQNLKQSWDLNWQAYVFANSGKTIQLNQNFVDYIGYDNFSTHHTSQPRLKEWKASNLKVQLDDVIGEWDINADKFRFKIGMRHTIPRYIVRKLRLNSLFKNIWNW